MFPRLLAQTCPLLCGVWEGQRPIPLTALPGSNSLPRWSEPGSACRRSSGSRPRRTERRNRCPKRDHSARPTAPCPPPLIYSLVINVFSAFLSAHIQIPAGGLLFLPAGRGRQRHCIPVNTPLTPRRAGVGEVGQEPASPALPAELPQTGCSHSCPHGPHTRPLLQPHHPQVSLTLPTGYRALRPQLCHRPPFPELGFALASLESGWNAPVWPGKRSFRQTLLGLRPGSCVSPRAKALTKVTAGSGRVRT